MNPREQVKIGSYRLGMTNVELYGLTHEQGGQFFCWPDATSLPRIKVGFAYNYWCEVVNVLLHETFEFLAAQKMARYVPCGAADLHASDIYLFQFDHNVFSQICDDQAYFLSKAMPDLATAWKKYRKTK